MIDIVSYWGVVLLASISSYVVLTQEDNNALLLACMGLGLWTVAAFSSFGLQAVNNGIITTYSYPALGVLFFMAAIVMLIGILELSFGVEILKGRV
jgi:hypothetical protein|tara:strand:- start:9871 stop:10158 length:288 start_codon:yes stop_codon:yes gene_type:complete